LYFKALVKQFPVMKKVLILLPRGFEFLELAAILDVFSWNGLEGLGGLEWKVVARDPWVESAAGQKIGVDLMINEDLCLEEFDALLLPGGFEAKGYFEDLYSEDFLKITQYFVDTARLIGTFCVASLVFTKVKFNREPPLLTTYAYGDGKRRQAILEAGLNLSEDKLCCDRNYLSCDGPGSALSLSFSVLETLTTRENALSIRKLMGISDC
jgi:protein deglycase